MLLDPPPTSPAAALRLLLVGFPAPFADAVRAALVRSGAEEAGGAIRVERVEPDAVDVSTGDGPLLLALGAADDSTSEPGAALDLLTRFFGGAVPGPGARRLALVLAGGPELERFQPFLDRDQLFYLSAEPPPEADILRLLVAAAQRLRQPTALPEAVDPGAELADELEAMLGGLGPEAGLLALVAAVEGFVEDRLDIERGTCWLHDPATETLHHPPRGERAPRQESAAVGLSSYVLRTGHGLRLERVGEDPRYDPEADNDGGPRDERFLAAPLLAVPLLAVPRVHGPPVGVLTAIRPPHAPAFADEDQELLGRLAARVAPALASAWTAALGRSPTEGADTPDARRQLLGDEAGLFRDRALDHYHDGLPDHGRVLEITPVWTGRVYRLLLALLLFAVVFGFVGRIHEYAEGRGGVRLEGRTDLVSPVAGTVSELAVRDGQRVRAGDVLVRLHGAQESAELHRLRREFELGLLERLRRPTDPIAARALSALRTQQQAAESRLDERSVRAPRDGVVSDLRVRAGQLVSPGETVLSLGADPAGAGELALVAVLPGRFRPQLEVGMPLRFELEGYRYAYQHLEIDSISDEVFGPTEARRALGPSLGDALEVNGPVVLVRARLSGPRFESDGRLYDYFDGSLGRVEVRVRSEPILVTLVPGLRALLGGGKGGP